MNSPILYNDPSGHKACGDGEEWSCDGGKKQDPDEDPNKREKGEAEEDEHGLKSPLPWGPICTQLLFCSELLYPEPYPWLPDYLLVDISIPVGPALGINIDPYIVDKYGNFYVAGGGGAGTSPIPGLKANFSVSGGYILDANTTELEVQAFLKEGSVSGCGGFIVGGCGTWGDTSFTKDPEQKDTAIQVGLFSPQIGGGFTFGLQLGD